MKTDAPSGKTISLLTATCIVVANMIGTGIFTSLGFQVGELPSGFVLMTLWALGGVCAFCGAVAYAELAAALPRSGGEYHFLGRIYHPALGFLSGWISLTVGFAAPVALAAMAFAKYAASLAPGWSPLTLSVGIVVLATLVHLRSITLGAGFQIATTFFKLALIVVFIGAGFLLPAHSEPISFLPRPGDAALLASTPFAVSLVYVMYAYAGWNASTYIVGEVRARGRTVPLSVALGTGLVALLYLGLNAVFLHVAPLAELRGQLDVGHVAANHIFGAAGGRVMAGLICIGLISAISAMTWVGPRVAMSMGEDYRALRWLGRKNARGIPSAAIAMQLIIVIALLLRPSFERLLTYVQFSLTLCSFLTVCGVFVLRWREPGLPRPYRTWGYPVTPLIFVAISGWMLVHIARSNPRESLWGLATMALGLILWFCSRAKPPLPPKPTAP